MLFTSLHNTESQYLIKYTSKENREGGVEGGMQDETKRAGAEMK